MCKTSSLLFFYLLLPYAIGSTNNKISFNLKQSPTLFFPDVTTSIDVTTNNYYR